MVAINLDSHRRIELSPYLLHGAIDLDCRLGVESLKGRRVGYLAEADSPSPYSLTGIGDFLKRSSSISGILYSGVLLIVFPVFANMKKFINFVSERLSVAPNGLDSPSAVREFWRSFCITLIPTPSPHAIRDVHH